MNNAQIIFNESIDLMKDGIIGTTGRKITVEYEKDGEMVKETIDEPEEIHTYQEWKKAGFQDLNPDEIELKYLITNILQFAK